MTCVRLQREECNSPRFVFWLSISLTSASLSLFSITGWRLGRWSLAWCRNTFWGIRSMGNFSVCSSARCLIDWPCLCGWKVAGSFTSGWLTLLALPSTVYISTHAASRAKKRCLWPGFKVSSGVRDKIWPQSLSGVFQHPLTRCWQLEEVWPKRLFQTSTTGGFKLLQD